MMPTSPSSPLKSVRRVFPGTASRLAYQTEHARADRVVKPAPGIPTLLRGRLASFVCSVAERVPALSVAARHSVEHRHASDMITLPQGPSLRSGFCCPGPSTLSWPHPSHSPAQHNFAAVRFICAAFAVRERLGDRRVVPCFRCAFCLDMPPSTTPGSSPAAYAQLLDRRPGLHTTLTVRHSQRPHNPLHVGQ
jgi:hypothetical protein